MSVKVKFKKLHPQAKTPKFATPGSAAFDIFAVSPWREVVMNRRGLRTRVFDTGLQFEVPENHVLLLFSRSGHGFKHNLRLANCVGVIDSDYRGEVKIKLTLDEEKEDDVSIDTESAIAQGMIVELPSIELTEVTEELSETERGAGGFGSTDNASVS